MARAMSAATAMAAAMATAVEETFSPSPRAPQSSEKNRGAKLMQTKQAIPPSLNVETAC
jgi:hypothetical protein